MAVKYLDDGAPDGCCIGQSASEKVSFFGATPVAQQAVVTTVDSTTITTCDTTIATTGLTAEDTLDDIIEAQALAINRLIADSRAQAVAINQLISKTRTLGLFASS